MLTPAEKEEFLISETLAICINSDNFRNAVLQCLFHLKDFNPSLSCPYDESKYPVTLKYLSLFNGVTNAMEKIPDLSTMPLKKSVCTYVFMQLKCVVYSWILSNRMLINS